MEIGTKYLKYKVKNYHKLGQHKPQLFYLYEYCPFHSRGNFDRKYDFSDEMIGYEGFIGRFQVSFKHFEGELGRKHRVIHSFWAHNTCYSVVNEIENQDDVEDCRTRNLEQFGNTDLGISVFVRYDGEDVETPLLYVFNRNTLYTADWYDIYDIVINHDIDVDDSISDHNIESYKQITSKIKTKMSSLSLCHFLEIYEDLLCKSCDCCFTYNSIDELLLIYKCFNEYDFKKQPRVSREQHLMTFFLGGYHPIPTIYRLSYNQVFCDVLLENLGIYEILRSGSLPISQQLHYSSEVYDEIEYGEICIESTNVLSCLIYCVMKYFLHFNSKYFNDIMILDIFPFSIRIFLGEDRRIREELGCILEEFTTTPCRSFGFHLPKYVKELFLEIGGRLIYVDFRKLINTMSDTIDMYIDIDANLKIALVFEELESKDKYKFDLKELL